MTIMLISGSPDVDMIIEADSDAEGIDLRAALLSLGADCKPGILFDMLKASGYDANLIEQTQNSVTYRLDKIDSVQCGGLAVN